MLKLEDQGMHGGTLNAPTRNADHPNRDYPGRAIRGVPGGMNSVKSTMDSELGVREAQLRGPRQRFANSRSLGDSTMGDFWAWAMSDLVVNSNRGLLAEYLVARALGDSTELRDPWRPYDVETPEGVTVEVKSASYIQAWAQKNHTYISFRIAPTRAWDPGTGEWDPEQRRQADVYVFALLDHKDQETVDPADLSQWVFYVLATEILNDVVGNAQTISLSRLNRLGATKIQVDELRTAVANAVATR